jgi:Ca2+:H+ antiporter
MTFSLKALLKPSLNWLLVFIPISAYLHYSGHSDPVMIFLSSAIAIIPLSALLGHGTEKVAEQAGDGWGGFLNATLGNAAEMIIAVIALKEGLIDVVKASLTGSILGNLLLVTGLSIVVGGMKHKSLDYNAMAAKEQVSTLKLVLVGLIIVGVFAGTGKAVMQHETELISIWVAGILLATYALFLYFSFVTHKELYSGKSEEEQHHTSTRGVRKGIIEIIISSVFIAWMSEILVHSVHGATSELGMSDVFVGVIIVAMVGNAAEHSSAIMVAIKNRMDLCFGIAIGSSIQIGLFVAPMLVLISMMMGGPIMDLAFTEWEILSLALSVIIAGDIVRDGKTNWFEGILLLMVYLVLAIAFYFVPA